MGNIKRERKSCFANYHFEATIRSIKDAKEMEDFCENPTKDLSGKFNEKTLSKY